MTSTASKPATDFMLAQAEYDRALAEPDFVARGWLEKDSRKKAGKAMRKATEDDARAVGMPTEYAARDGKVGLVLRDTYEEPSLVSAHAARRRLDLANGADCLDMAIEMTNTIEAKNAVERGIAHQMAAAHTMALKMARQSTDLLERAQFLSGGAMQTFTVEGVRLANASARMMAAYQSAAETLAKLRTGGKQTVTVTHIHQHVQVAGGNVAIAGAVQKVEQDGGSGDGG